MSELVSIIIPVYNVAPYIVDTLRSIEVAAKRISSGRSVEIVCVDDGATDGSGRILEDYLKKLNTTAADLDFCSTSSFELQVIHQANAGVAAARNRGLEAATGKWVWFVDGDDLIHPDSLTVLAEFDAKFPDADYLMFNYSHNPKFLEERQVFPAKRFKLSDDGASAEVFREVCRVFFRRDLIGSQRFRGFKIGEDVVFSLTYRAAHREGCIVPSVLYYYRIREGSATGDKAMSAEKTVDWIRSNRIIFKKMSEIIGNGELVWWYPSSLWQGFHGSPHNLPFKAARPFYREFVDLLCDVNRYCPYSWNRRLALTLLHAFPSPVLGWLLIYGQERLIQLLARWRGRS